MKYFFLLLTFILSAYRVHSQANKIAFDYKKRIELQLSSTERITSSSFANKLYYSSRNWDKHYNSENSDSLRFLIYSYDYKNDKHDSFKLSIPGGGAFNYQISSFSVNDKYIALMIDKVYLFDWATKKYIRDFSTLKARDIKVLDNGDLLVTENYNFHPLDDTVKTKLVVYDVNTGIMKKAVTPHFDMPILTNLTSKNIDACDGLIAFAQSLSYDITFYNTATLEVSSVIQGNAIVNDTGQLSKLNDLQGGMFKANEIKNTITEAAEIDNNISRIQYIQFLTDNSILVVKRIPGNNTARSLDVWQLKNDNWIQLVKDQLYEMNRTKEDIVATSSNSPLYFIYSTIFHSNPKSLMVVTDFVPVEIGMKHTDFNAYQDKYFTDHELRYQLLIYDWQLKER